MMKSALIGIASVGILAVIVPDHLDAAFYDGEYPVGLVALAK
jgi:hypothetical protein